MQLLRDVAGVVFQYLYYEKNFVASSAKNNAQALKKMGRASRAHF